MRQLIACYIRSTWSTCEDLCRPLLTGRSWMLTCIGKQETVAWRVGGLKREYAHQHLLYSFCETEWKISQKETNPAKTSLATSSANRHQQLWRANWCLPVIMYIPQRRNKSSMQKGNTSCDGKGHTEPWISAQTRGEGQWHGCQCGFIVKCLYMKPNIAEFLQHIDGSCEQKKVYWSMDWWKMATENDIPTIFLPKFLNKPTSRKEGNPP